MRISSCLLCAFLLAPGLLASTLGDVWRPPVPVPAQCTAPLFELILLDVSRPMSRSGAFAQAQAKAVEQVLYEVPDCTLVIVGSFGVTADVRGGEFLVDSRSRLRLAQSIRALRATHPHTNLDEAAKLIELLDYQLRAAYGGTASRLIVLAYTDNQSEPSAGRPKFSLAEYLARRMNARHVRVAFSDHESDQRTPRPAPAPPRPKPAQTGGAGWLGRRAAGPVLLSGLLLLATGIVGLWFRRRSKVPPRTSTPLQALLVAESDEPRNGQAANRIREQRVDVCTRVPVVFSTDPEQGTYVAAPLPDAEPGELFRVTPLADGRVLLETQRPQATLNGKPIGRRKIKVGLAQPVRICLERRVFALSGAYGVPEVPRAGEGLFHAQALEL
jgi:hypothetical protein